MTRPPLTIALSSVLAAAIDGAGRPGLLATLHPEFGRPPRSGEDRDRAQDRAEVEGAGLAEVITLPRVIPMPRRGLNRILGPIDQVRDPQVGDPQLDPDPTSAA